MAVADVDVERLRLERMRTLTFNSAAVAAGHPETAFRRIAFEHEPQFDDVGLERVIDRFPFVPDDPARLDRDCYEAFNIQVQGLMKRMQVTNGERIVIGVSGGLDSTHALIVAAKAFDALGLPRKNILGFTMPGFATSEGTKSNAWALMNALGVTGEEIDIKPAAMQHAEGHRPSVRRRASRSTTSRSRTCRRDCAPTISSGSPTSARRSCSARATSPSSRSAGAPTASATT